MCEWARLFSLLSVLCVRAQVREDNVRKFPHMTLLVISHSRHKAGPQGAIDASCRFAVETPPELDAGQITTAVKTNTKLFETIKFRVFEALFDPLQKESEIVVLPKKQFLANGYVEYVWDENN